MTSSDKKPVPPVVPPALDKSLSPAPEHDAHIHDSHHVGGHIYGLPVRAAIASSATAILLTGIKVYAFTETDSAAILASLLDTLLDLLASLITLLGVSIAARPADLDHRFGHGKAEAISALAQCFLILASALAIFARAIMQIYEGAPPQAPEIGMGAILISMVLTLGLLAYQRFVLRHTASVAIHTDHLHYKSDFLMGGGVILALFLSQWDNLAIIDGITGALIALYLGWGGWQSGWQAIDILMDKEWADDRRAIAQQIVQSHPDVQGVHDIRTRQSGLHGFLQLKIVLDPTLSLQDAHEIIATLEQALQDAFPHTEILIRTTARKRGQPTG